MSARMQSVLIVVVLPLSRVRVCLLTECVIRKVAANGLVSTFAGSRRKATVDGTGTFASFNGPNSVAIDAYVWRCCAHSCDRFGVESRVLCS